MYVYYVPTARLLTLRIYREPTPIPLYRIELPRRISSRRLAVLHRRLGLNRALNLPPPHLAAAALPLISTQPLWQNVAAQLALCELGRLRRHRRDAVVGIRASRLSEPVWQVMEILSTQVRALALDIPDRDRAALWLQRRAGIPVLEGAGEVTLCFCPTPPGEGRLMLWEERPAFADWTLAATGVEVPEDCPVEGFLAAMAERGQLQSPVFIVKARK